MGPRPADQALIDRFIDALWLEDGLAANSLAAYRRDLAGLAAWLPGWFAQSQPGMTAELAPRLNELRETHLLAYITARHANTRATSANRRLTVFKRFYRWALREHLCAADPTLRLSAARQPLRLPHSLSEAQVEALLAAPDVNTPLGLRDRTMFELMYAAGLRVSELTTLKLLHLSLNDGVLKVIGKGSKERLLPFGEIARDWVMRYLVEARPQLLAGRACDELFVTVRGAGMTRQMA
jgi:integrase/recombinase XerD